MKTLLALALACVLLGIATRDLGRWEPEPLPAPPTLADVDATEATDDATGTKFPHATDAP